MSSISFLLLKIAMVLVVLWDTLAARTIKRDIYARRENFQLEYRACNDSMLVCNVEWGWLSRARGQSPTREYIAITHQI